jgi:UDP-GlcNAc:undecaprenyl-phosphate/decaprenyl-phosphate GlcNAc-1-phosphate transferase
MTPSATALSPQAGMGQSALGLGALVLLMTPPVRRYSQELGLVWLYLVGVAFAAAFSAVPIVRGYAVWRGVLDEPSSPRKLQAAATPLLGGLGVYFAFALTVLFNFSFSRELKGVALGATAIVIVGMLDDLLDLPAAVKLGGQVMAAVIAMSWDVTLHVAPNWLPGFFWLNAALTLLWFVTVTNAVQFLDGMDGLAAGLGAIAGVFFSITAIQTGQRFLTFLSAALVGACLGFLPYNFRPGGARIFLGDGGASFIGFTLAGLAVMGEWAENGLVGLVTPTLILGVPLFDIAFVGTVRVVTGKVHSVREWLAYAARDHIHHRFEALGFTRVRSVFLIFSISTTLGLSAMLLEHATPPQAVLILLQAVCVLFLIAVLETVGRGRGR